MDYRYFENDPELASKKELLEKLFAVFQELLTRSDGDPEQALEWMRSIDRRVKLFDQGITPEKLRELLEKHGFVTRGRDRRLALTKKTERSMRASALEHVFGALQRDLSGAHRVPAAGAGLERLSESRAYEFGDPVHAIDPVRTLSNALRAGNLDTLSVREEDLHVFETEHSSSCATVLMVDVSHSMILYGEDRITPAKRVALALCELITTRYPKDSLDVILFGDTAWQVSIEELPYLAAGPHHTNTRAGLELAREILRKKKQHNRRIVMLTDGKPSAITERNGQVYKNPFGLDRRIVNKTLEEAEACRRLRIPITTFMLTTDPTLVDFVKRFTEVNHGRAYYSELDRLGSFVLVDYVENRVRRVR